MRAGSAEKDRSQKWQRLTPSPDENLFHLMDRHWEAGVEEEEA